MPEIEASEKRQGLHLACFRSTSIESKENFLARTPKMPAKCESQANLQALCEPPALPETGAAKRADAGGGEGQMLKEAPRGADGGNICAAAKFKGGYT